MILKFRSAIFIESIHKQDVTLKLGALKTQKQAIVFLGAHDERHSRLNGMLLGQ